MTHKKSEVNDKKVDIKIDNKKIHTTSNFKGCTVTVDLEVPDNVDFHYTVNIKKKKLFKW